MRTTSVLLILLCFIPLPTAAEQIALTAAEKGFLAEHPVIRVGNEMDWPPFDFVENGEATGYSIDLLNLIAEKTGLQLKYINGYTWDELLEMGFRREIDVFPAMWKTAKREKHFNFSEPYIDTPYILVVHEDESEISGINSLKGRTLTGIKGFASTKQAKQHYPQITIVEVNNAVEGLRQVSYGRADAYLGSMAETNFVIKSHLVPNLKIAGETDLDGRIDPPLLYIGVRQDWPRLMGIIERGMDAISQAEKQALQLKWLEFDKSGQALTLNEAERAYLQNHPVLRGAFAEDWPPVAYAGKNHQMVGIAADYLEKISRRLNVEIEPVAPGDWPDMVKAVQSGDLDFFSAVSPAVRQRHGMAFTDAYLNFPIVIVTREDVPYVGDLKFLADKMVAVVDGQAAHERLSANHPNLALTPVQGVKEGLLTVAGMDAFAFVGSLATVSHVIGREGLTTLKVSGETPYTVDISMATRKADTVLLGLLQKALSGISVQERNAIYSKWSGVTFEYQADYSLLWKIGIGVMVLFLLILYWNRRLRRMAGALKSARDSAESANRAKSAFLANMSHELRTPLNAILGFSQIMADDAGLNQNQKDNLRIINSSGEHLLSLLSDILDMSKIEAGRIVLNPAVFDLHRLMDDIRDMLKPSANEKGLYLSFTISPEIPRYIYSDKARLRQILVNLVVNGLKHTNRGGVRVSVGTAPAEEAASAVRLDFMVQDTGSGIAPEFQEKIFEPFMQLPTGKQTSEGTGLGLSICRTLVEMMGGEIHLESEPGKGATFSFSIRVGTDVQEVTPAIEKPGDAAVSVPYQLAADQPECRVLVVDDVENNRKLMMAILRTAGFAVRGAADAESAFVILAEWAPHLIWLDIQMAEMDGLAAARRIREDGFDKVKIIGISASAFEEDKAASLAAGCDDFVSKPVNRMQILEKMAAHLNVAFEARGQVAAGGPVEPAYEKAWGPHLMADVPTAAYRLLHQAVFSFDYEMTLTAIDQIRDIDAYLAERLAAQAANYQFGRLQALFTKQEAAP